MLSPLLLLSAVLTDFILFLNASPTPSSTFNARDTSQTTIPLRRRAPPTRSEAEWGEWAKSHRDGLTLKYGGKILDKRASGTNLLVNHNADSSYYGSIALGTPAVSYDVLLDTGSSDLWVADTDCVSGCSSIPRFDTKSSTSFVDQSTAFSITYGSGAASGTLGQDVMQMAGFKIPNQIFAVCNTVSQGLLDDSISGLMGLAFKGIASSGATPFWETLVTSGAWDSPLMAFQLTRFGNDGTASAEEYGGSFTMGATNSTLFTGDIEYYPLSTTHGLQYWTISLSAITVGGNDVSLTSSLDCGLDTGTTLLGGPANDIAAIYAQIDGAQAGTGNYDGYYTFPCSTPVSVSLTFGGKSWPISSADMIHAQISASTCLGAFFVLTTGTSAPTWIMGDTFLKNVYTVFRYTPAAVGFAILSNTALAENGGIEAVPSATIGSASSAVSATSGSTRSSSGKNSASSLGASGRGALTTMALAIGFIIVFSVL